MGTVVRAAVSVALVMGMTAGWGVAAQSPVVPLERASALKATYPFVRFSTLTSFDVPQTDDWDPLRSPHASRAAGAAGHLNLPPAVVALHGTRASVRGYMLPVDVTANGVASFILTSSIDACHWGMTGLPHEWVLVTMAGGARVPFLKFQPVTVFGRLAVEPVWRGPVLTGLYQMSAEFISADGL